MEISVKRPWFCALRRTFLLRHRISFVCYISLALASMVPALAQCPASVGVVGLQATQQPSTTGLGSVTLSWSPPPGVSVTGYVGWVFVPTFDYTIDPSVPKSVDPSGVAINPYPPASVSPVQFVSDVGSYTIQFPADGSLIPSDRTSYTISNLALFMPYTIWLEPANASVNENGQTISCQLQIASSAVSLTTTAAPGAQVWGFADTHTHPFANDAYDLGSTFFVGKAWGPRNAALSPDLDYSGNAGEVAEGVAYCIFVPFNCTDPATDVATVVADPWPLAAIYAGTQLGHGSQYGMPGHSTDGFPTFSGWPTYNGLLHQQMYSDWLFRAYLGGLRLIVAHAVNNELLCAVGTVSGRSYANIIQSPSLVLPPGILDFTAIATAVTSQIAQTDLTSCDDMAAVDRQLTDAYQMENYLNNECPVAAPPRCPQANMGWFHIVKSAGEARQTINRGQLAVVLGIEVDRLFDCQLSSSILNLNSRTCTRADIQAALDKYYLRGVRHLFISHLANTAFAGMAIYPGEVPWDANNLVLNGKLFDTESCPSSTVPGMTYSMNYNNGSTNNMIADLTALLNTLADTMNPIGALISGGQMIQPPSPYQHPTCNAMPFSELGSSLVVGLKARGMIIDMDHLSLESWKRLKLLLNGYPVIAGHTGALGVQVSGTERQINDEQLQYLHQNNGLVGIGVNQGAASSINQYPSVIDGTFVPNDCDQSVKSFAQSYIYIRDREWDTAVMGIASDQSLNPLISPRFGSGACSGNAAQAALQSENPRVTYNGPNGRFLAIAGPGTNPPVVALWVKEVDDKLNQTRQWNFNTDGLAQLGLYPEFTQELANLLGFEPTGLYSSAEAYLDMWAAAEKASGGYSGPTYISIFVTDFGHVWENYWDQTSQQWLWADHGLPPGILNRAVGTPGAAFNSPPKLFVRGTNGHMIENYWDQSSGTWGWTDHGTPTPLTQIVTDPGVAFDSPATGIKYFMCGSDGHVWENYWDQSSQQWLWTDHGIPPGTLAVGTPGAAFDSADSPPKFFVRGANGHMLENHWTQTSATTGYWGWTDHGTPPSAQVVSDPGAAFDSAAAGIKYFMSGSDGHVWENYWDQSSQQWLWTDHGLPPGTLAVGTPGAAFDSADSPPKFFVRGANGHMLENHWTQTSATTGYWGWTDHETPRPGVQIVTDPGVAFDSPATGIKYFMGGSDGHIWENYWDQTSQQWLWTDHGLPPGLTALDAVSTPGVSLTY
jgi:hypothetical protein